MTPPLTIIGGTIVTPTETIQNGTVRIVGDTIQTVGSQSGTRSVDNYIDVSGQYVLPGLVDLHGDDIERFLSPRPEERIPVEEALRQSERAAIAAGITTKFHAVAYEDAPEQGRTIERAEQLSGAILRRQDEAPIDTRVHARCEVGDEASVATVTDRVHDGGCGLASLMNHVPGEGQYSTPEAFSKRYKAAPDEAVGVKTEAPIEDLIQSRGAVAQPIVDRHRDAVVAAARSADVPVASHDDVDEKAVDRAANHGIDICEFPVTLEAARRAGERDMTVAMGAPNLVRGGSLWGNLDASVALKAGLVDILCSDFRPQTLLKSIFSDSGDSVHERVARVSSKPARAVGLNDRGRLESGARADVIVVDPEPSPTVSRVFVAGDEVYRFNSH